MRYLYLTIFTIVLISCDSTRVYEDYNDLEDAFWQLDSIQTFQFEIEDTTKVYNLYATFRNASGYPFYNLYFQYTLADSSQNVIKQELREINFFDPKTGEPKGSGIGDLFDHTYTLDVAYDFKAAGLYSIQLQQFMRMDTLPYLLSVGARIEIVE